MFSQFAFYIGELTLSKINLPSRSYYLNIWHMPERWIGKQQANTTAKELHFTLSNNTGLLAQM